MSKNKPVSICPDAFQSFITSTNCRLLCTFLEATHPNGEYCHKRNPCNSEIFLASILGTANRTEPQDVKTVHVHVHVDTL